MSFALNEDNALIIFEFINFVKLQNSFLPNLYIISNVKISYILLFLFLYLNSKYKINIFYILYLIFI
jgi:hypothetical protein